MRPALLAALTALALTAAGCSGGHAVTYIPPQSEIHPEGSRPAQPPTEHVFGLSPATQKHISIRGLHLIEGFEGFSSHPYWDPSGGVWTRGYGETEGIHEHSSPITRAFGEANLRSRIERFYEWSLRALGRDFNQNQWDALDSFVWNLGAGIFQGSTLGAELRAGQYFAASRSMLAYDHARGQVLDGLARRRRAEVALFLTPTPAPPPAPSRAQQLAHWQHEITRLHHELAVHHCRTIHGRRAYRGCPVLAREGKHAHREAHRLGA